MMICSAYTRTYLTLEISYQRTPFAVDVYEY
jgi:hypothetical protein